jgi:hypothetical protein
MMLSIVDRLLSPRCSQITLNPQDKMSTILNQKNFSTISSDTLLRHPMSDMAHIANNVPLYVQSKNLHGCLKSCTKVFKEIYKCIISR